MNDSTPLILENVGNAQGQAGSKMFADAYSLGGIYPARAKSDTTSSMRGQGDTVSQHKDVDSQFSAQHRTDQFQLANTVALTLKQADALAQPSDAAKAGELYKNAWTAAEKIDQDYLATKLGQNGTTEKDKATYTQILINVKEARMRYATFLTRSGQYSEALPIALNIAADTPETVAGSDDYNRLVSQAMYGKSMTQAQLQAHLTQFGDQMQHTQLDQATATLDALTQDYTTTKVMVDQNNRVLSDAIKGIDASLQDLKFNQNDVAPDFLKTKTDRLQSEKGVLEKTEAVNGQFERQLTYLKYLQGVLAYAKQDTDTAHALFQEVQKDDPELAQQVKINDLLDATRDKSWFEENWKSLAMGGAIVVGIGVSVATFGIGAPEAIGGVGALAAALAVGAGAGSATYVGVKGAATGFDKITPVDFIEGAADGATGASIGFSLFGGLAKVGATAVEAGAESATTGTATAATAEATASDLAANAPNLLSKVTSLGKPLAVGSSFALAKETYNVVADGKPVKDAAIAFVPESLLYGLGAGSLRTVLLASTLDASKQAAELPFTNWNADNAVNNFFADAPSTMWGLGTARSAAQKSLQATGIIHGGTKATLATLAPQLIENAGSSVNDFMNRKPLDPKNNQQLSEIWNRYNSVSPDSLAPQPSNQTDSTAPQNYNGEPAPALSKQQQQDLIGQPIRDYPHTP